MVISKMQHDMISKENPPVTQRKPVNVPQEQEYIFRILVDIRNELKLLREDLKRR